MERFLLKVNDITDYDLFESALDDNGIRFDIDSSGRYMIKEEDAGDVCRLLENMPFDYDLI